MGGWGILIYVLFPVPLLCLTLLCVPLPSFVDGLRKYMLKGVDLVLFSKFAGPLNLYSLCTVISSLVFLSTCFDLARASDKLASSHNTLHLSEDRLKCSKWRTERNFWITLMSTFLWLILFRVYRMAQQLEEIKIKVKEQIRKND